METAEEKIKKLEDLINKNDIEKAKPLCEDLIKELSDRAEPYYFKALIIWSETEVKNLPKTDFASFLDKAVKLKPDYKQPHMLWGRVNQLLGYYKLALQGYIRAYKADSNDMQACAAAGEMFFETGNYEDAACFLKCALKNSKEPLNTNIFYMLGQSQYHISDYAGAKQSYDKDLEINPKRVKSIIGRGLCLSVLRKYDEALKEFSSAIELSPDSFEVYGMRGDIKVRLGDLRAALPDYQKALELNPTNERSKQAVGELQNELLKQIPQDSKVIYSTLKNGFKAMTVILQDGMPLTFWQLNEEPTAPQNIEVKASKPVQQETQQEHPITKPKDGELIKAANAGNCERIKQLLKDGSNINETNCFKDNALRRAISSRKTQAAIVLIETGAELDSSNKAGQTALMLAIQYRNLEVLKALCKAGADLNIKDINGQTALMYACKINNADFVKVLLQAGADFKLKDNRGNTALILSERFSFSDKTVFNILKSSGAEE